jgi:predicted transglutaminase-like cysteine proteinase
MSALAATLELGYARSVTSGLVQAYVSRFGENTRMRLAGWQRFIAILGDRREQDEIALLRRVNDFMNVTPYLPDSVHWQVEDYWATPAELIGSHGGDCEDYVVAKYFALKELGVPPAKLRMVYVMARIGKTQQPHMVLAYYSAPSAVPLILDNDIRNDVTPATQRPDLVPVYSFNDDESALRSPREYPNQARRWTELMDKLRRELQY